MPNSMVDENGGYFLVFGKVNTETLKAWIFGQN
jgi:hypothetical protein